MCCLGIGLPETPRTHLAHKESHVFIFVFFVCCIGTGPPETPRTHLAHKESQAAPAIGAPALPARCQAGMLRYTTASE